MDYLQHHARFLEGSNKSKKHRLDMGSVASASNTSSNFERYNTVT